MDLGWPRFCICQWFPIFSVSKCHENELFWITLQVATSGSFLTIPGFTMKLLSGNFPNISTDFLVIYWLWSANVKFHFCGSWTTFKILNIVWISRKICLYYDWETLFILNQICLMNFLMIFWLWSAFSLIFRLCGSWTTKWESCLFERFFIVLGKTTLHFKTVLIGTTY